MKHQKLHEIQASKTLITICAVLAVLLVLPVHEIYAQQDAANAEVVPKEDSGFTKWFKELFAPPEAPMTRPEITLEAPFKGEDDFEGEEGMGFNALKQKSGAEFSVENQDFSIPHRPDPAVAVWLQRALSEAFSIQQGDYDKHLSHLSTGMNDDALREYDKFVNDSNLLANVQAGKYKIQVAIDKEPDLLCKFAQEGRFRWLFDMPLTFTLLPSNIDQYDKKTDLKNWELSVIAQVGRIPEGGIDGVIIEHLVIRKWSQDWEKHKLLAPDDLPCSWDEVMAMVQ